MIYVTHDQIEAMTMADRIVVLRAGRVEQLGATTFAYCVLPNGERLTVQSAGQAAHALGEVLRVALPRAHLHVFDADDGRSLLARA